MRAQRIALVVMVLGLLLPRVAWAQSSGSFAGVVKDATGAVMPGVTVEAASPALIEKVRSVVTDDQGAYKIVDLRPGTYTVTFSLTGFSTVKREGLELNTGITLPVNAELKVGSLAETVTVSGASPVVDIQNVKSQTMISRDIVLDALPTARNYQGLTALTLGVSSSSPGAGLNRDVGGSRGESVFALVIHGGSPGLLTVDGQRATSLLGNGTAHRYQLNQLAVQEVTLETSGVGAESESGGLNVNMVSKDGGNTFTGTFNGEYTGKGLQNNNLDEALRARGLNNANSTKRVYDVGFGLGGPLKKDKLWFFTAHRWWGSQLEFAGVYFNKTQDTLFYTPDLSRPGYNNNYQKDNGLRLTWQATPKQKIAVAANLQEFCWCYYFVDQTNGPRSAEATYDLRVRPDNLIQGNWSYPATNRLLVEAGASVRPDRQLNGKPAETGNARPVLELSSGIAYGSMFAFGSPTSNHWLNDLGDMGNAYSYSTRVGVSYITGSHAFKTGVTTMAGEQPVGGNPNFNVQYIFRNRVPVGLSQVASPNYYVSKLKLNLGIFAQEQWTLTKLTLNLGVRFDYLNAYDPAQSRPAGEFLSAIDFPATYNVPNWKDLSPRLGATYDLFGNGKTALKVALSRYVVAETVTLAGVSNPAFALADGTTRTWNDANGDYVPDCDLKNPLANGECGAMANQRFGTSVVTTHYADDVTNGWGVRPFYWQGSAAVQHELRPGVGLTVGYFRTWYGNFRVTDNRAVTPSDFSPYSITAPVDARLPGGGGYVISGLYDVTPAKFGQVDNLVSQASHFGTQSQVFNGVDVTFNARFGRGGVLSGGVSTGRTVTDLCAQRLPSALFCKQTLPFAAQTQVKLSGVYPLPWGLQGSAVFQNLPGIPISASYTATNAQIAPSLGRNLAACGTAVTCTATATIQLIEPNTQFEKRETEFDVRLSRTVRLGRMRLQPKFDIYNLFNANTVIRINPTYGSNWLIPQDILGARTLKFGVQLDF